MRISTIIVLVRVARGKARWQTMLQADYVPGADKRILAVDTDSRSGIIWLGKRVPTSQWEWLLEA